MALLDSLLGQLGIGSNQADSGTYTPESIEMRRKMALAMMQPHQIRSNAEGLNYLARSILGAYNLNKLDKEDKAAQKSADDLLISTLGGGAADMPVPPAIVRPLNSNPGGVDTGALPSAKADISGIDPNDPLALIKREEGFAPQAKWDVRQYSGGYGSKAAQGETFTREKAEQYLARDAKPSLDWVAKNVPNATPGQRSALVSFGYNLGTDDLDKLLPDIQAGDWPRVAQRMQRFNQAAVGPGGSLQPLEGLTNRRAREAALILADSGSQPQNASIQGASAQVAPSGTSRAQQMGAMLMRNPRTADLGRKLLIEAATREAPKDPDNVREYKFAVSQGYAKPYSEWVLESKRAGVADQANKPSELMKRGLEMGLKPGTPEMNDWLRTVGKAEQMTDATRRQINEADDQIAAGRSATGNLDQALKLNEKAYSGPAASLRGYFTSLFGSEAGENTQNLENLVGTQALSQLRTIFGGNPTEGERKILLELQGSVNQTPKVRAEIWGRAKTMAETRVKNAEREAEQLRGGTFYRPGGGQSKGPEASGTVSPPSGERSSPITGARQAADGNWYVADPQRPGKYLKVEQ